MTFEEQLTRAFDTLTDRLRGEIDSHVRRASAELIAAAPYDRDPAVVEAARAELELAVAAARRDAHEAGQSAGAEAARVAALAELESAVATARQEAHQAGHSAGEEAARNAARIELESAVAAARQEAHDAGLAAGIDAGLAEGTAAGRAAVLEEIQARAQPPTDSAPDQALMDAVRTIERARSLTEILDALVSGASSDAWRADVWLHRGGGLHRWRAPATADDTSAAPATAPENGRIIADAVRMNAVASADGALAVPIAISGEVVAVLVAQPREAGTPNPEPGTANAERRTPNVEPRTTNDERRTTNVELLTRYASRSLEALTAFKTARALTQRPEPAASAVPAAVVDEASAEEDTSARRYARLLISEIKLYHEDAVVEGRRDRDLATRLGGEIARARVMFEQRVPPHVRERTDYFQDELVRTLANGDASLLELRIRN